MFDTHSVNPALFPNLPFDTDKDFDPVMLIATAPYVVAAHPVRPLRATGLIEAAKAKPTRSLMRRLAAAVSAIWRWCCSASRRVWTCPCALSRRRSGPERCDRRPCRPDQWQRGAVDLPNSGRSSGRCSRWAKTRLTGLKDVRPSAKPASRAPGQHLVGRLCAGGNTTGDDRNVRRRDAASLREDAPPASSPRSSR